MYVYWQKHWKYVEITYCRRDGIWDNEYIIPPGTVLTDLRRETWEAKRDNWELEGIG